MLSHVSFQDMETETEMVITQLNQIGDMSLRRRIVTMMGYLELGNPGLVILDAGCGDGLYAQLIVRDHLAPHSPLLHAVDVDFGIAGEMHFDGVCFWEREIERLNELFCEECFDRILCTEVLEHVSCAMTALESLFRMLKPGGILSVTVPCRNYPFWWDPVSKVQEWVGMRPKSGIWNMHRELFHPRDIRALAENAGFIVEHMDMLTHYCVPFSMQILRLGALIHSRIPVPGTDRHGEGPGRWNPLRGIKWVFEKIDALNNQTFDTDTSAVNVALKMRRP